MSTIPPLVTANLGLLPQLPQGVEAAAGRFAPLFKELAAPPFRIVADSSVLFNTHSTDNTGRAPQDHVPDWDGKGGLEGWRAYQNTHHDLAPPPGRAHALIRKLLTLNQYATDPYNEPLVRVDVVSKMPYALADRFMKAIERDFSAHSNQGIRRFSYGQNGKVIGHGASDPRIQELIKKLGLEEKIQAGGPIPNLLEFGANLYITASPYWAAQALLNGIAAVYIPPHINNLDTDDGQPIIVSFDCDGVIIDDEAEKEFQKGATFLERLFNFDQHETNLVNTIPLLGPLFPAFLGLYGLASLFSHLPSEQRPFRIIMVTARGPATQRRIKASLRKLGLNNAEVMSAVEQMSGEEKGPWLVRNNATVHFDDSPKHIGSALKHGIIAGHVVDGVVNEAIIAALAQKGDKAGDQFMLPFYK
ncbi:MAG: 5'-nucleotidase [Deltaproteobacteria bacterium]|nr:5'-nucleotidase [Deltaproteobacteria bacterium]